MASKIQWICCVVVEMIESTEHFLLPFPLFLYERCSLLSTLGKFKYSLLENTSNVSKQFFLELFQLVEPITPRFFMLQLILSYRVKYLMKSFFRYQMLCYTEHKQANNLKSLTVCNFKPQIFLVCQCWDHYKFWWFVFI